MRFDTKSTNNKIDKLDFLKIKNLGNEKIYIKWTTTKKANNPVKQ